MIIQILYDAYGAAMDSKKAKLLAKYEVGWWQEHGRRHLVKAADFMVKGYRLQFNLPYDIAKKIRKLQNRRS